MTTETVRNFRIEHALACADKGWRIIPIHWPRIGATGKASCSCGNPECASVGKHPLTPEGLKQGTVAPTAIGAWWAKWPAANCGIVTGAESGIIVLDVDTRDGGGESLGELMDSYGQLPETLEVQTGSGGLHLFFNHPGRRIPNSTSKVGKGIDVRGDGGYVVAPPSLHASGQRYAWRDEAGINSPIADAPDWLLHLMAPPPVERPPERRQANPSDTATRFLGHYLAKATYGKRNETGHLLAIQLRDNGVSAGEAERVMRDYAQRCPRGDKPYTETEAVATVRSAYNSPARAPAPDKPREAPRRQQVAAAKDETPAVVKPGAAAELHTYLKGVASGAIRNVPWPWPTMTRLTFALLPGTVTCIVGDPKVGKTFFILQCLQFWLANEYDPAVLFIEKDRRFHTMRLLAQLDGKGRFVDYEWLPGKDDEVDAAIAEHGDDIDRIGMHIHSADNGRMTLAGALAWVRAQASAGKRIIVVDPITILDAGEQRWAADDAFVDECQRIATSHGCSVVLVTHAKKGNRTGKTGGHDMAGGAAYHRFVDTAIWIHKPVKPRTVQYQTRMGPSGGKIGIFFQLFAARNGKGQGLELAYTFGDGLKFAEQGVVLKDLPDGGGDDTETEDPFVPRPVVRAPAVPPLQQL